MKLGVFSMLAHPPHRGYPDVVEEDLQMLVLADELGFSEAWLGEHFTSIWENIPPPDLLIAQALRCTKRIKLATGVSSIPNHNPAQLANRIAQLDIYAHTGGYGGLLMLAYDWEAKSDSSGGIRWSSWPRRSCPGWRT